jgi:hypothetical protein
MLSFVRVAAMFAHFSVLDAFIDLSSDISMVGHPVRAQDPRYLVRAPISGSVDGNDEASDDYGNGENDVEQPIQRDVEWRPRNGGIPWRLCSGLMWSR